MIVVAWRIVKTRHAAQAFEGEGARLYGGRWNSVGTRMIYCASSIALAALEILVHLEQPIALKGWSLLRVTFDDSLLTRLPMSALPENWSADLPTSAVRTLGDRWIEEQSSMALAVPSVIIPEETNYLLNPDHPEFPRVRIDAARPFTLDARLVYKISSE